MCCMGFGKDGGPKRFGVTPMVTAHNYEAIDYSDSASEIKNIVLLLC